MTVADFGHIIEQWAPPWIAWEKDNVGLQVGELQSPVRRVHLCLDVTPDVLKEASEKKADLVFSHHPLLFRRPASVTDSDPIGELILQAAKKRIAVYSAHTNLDFTRGGVSFALAETLGLEAIDFLSPLKRLLAKIAVFVPETHLESVLDAMANSGAGVLGEYSHCSFQLKGRGTFQGSAESKPFLGKAGAREAVEETRLEMIAPRARVRAIVASMKSVHPYEEPAYDVYPLDNESGDYGAGAIGELPSGKTLESFIRATKKALSAESVRWCKGRTSRIRKVAVCGGSGSDLLSTAIASGADAFVTADVRYHAFHEAEGRIALIDAGHYETEVPVLDAVARRLERDFKNRGERITVTTTRIRTSPIHSI